MLIKQMGLKIDSQEPLDKLEASVLFRTMCRHRIQVTKPKDVDDQVIAWLALAYQQA